MVEGRHDAPPEIVRTRSFKAEWTALSITPSEPHRRRRPGRVGAASNPHVNHSSADAFVPGPIGFRRKSMNSIIYLVGLVVVVLAILAFIGVF
ncbi:MAG TPA: hypothetical protein VMP03_03580 [Methylomirabilota bacterium]|nr:hypothetical protein [Methylomirabilota bacterium]